MHRRTTAFVTLVTALRRTARRHRRPIDLRTIDLSAIKL
jgi:hypothetical protein